MQPQVHGGEFDEVNLGYLDGTKASAPVGVSLQFDASFAGVGVWVQPLDGGVLIFQDATGNAVNVPQGSFIPLNAAGQLVFTFQAPTHTGRYQVLIRMRDTSTILPFIILDPTQDN